MKLREWIHLIREKWGGQLDKNGGQRWNRTTDTRIFNPLLYRLSYLATLSNLSLESESAVLNRLGVLKSRIIHAICYFSGM